MATKSLVPQDPKVREITFYSGSNPLQVCDHRLNQVSQDVHSVAVNSRFQKILREKIHTSPDNVTPIFFVLEEERVVVIDRSNLENGPTEIRIDEFDPEVQKSIHSVLHKANEVWSGCGPCARETEVKTLRERVQHLEGQLQSQQEAFQLERQEFNMIMQRKDSELKRAQVIIQQQQETLSDQQRQIQELNSKIESLTLTIEDLTKRNESLLEQNATQIKTYEDRLSAARQELEQVRQEASSSSEKVKAASSSIEESLREEIHKLESKVVILEKARDNLSSTHAKKLNELQDSHRETLEEKTILLLKLAEELANTKSLLETTTERLERDLANSKESAQNAETSHRLELEKRDAEIEDLKRKIQSFQIEQERKILSLTQNHQAEISSRKQELAEVQEALSKKEAQLEALVTTHKEELDRAEKALLSIVERQEKTVPELEESLGKIESLTREIADLRASQEVSKQKHAKGIEELHIAHTAKLQGKKQELDALQAELTEALKKAFDLQVASLTKEHARVLEEMKSKLNSLESDYQKATTELLKLKKEKEELLAAQKSLVANTEASPADNKKLLEAISEMSQLLASCEGHVSELEQAIEANQAQQLSLQESYAEEFDSLQEQYAETFHDLQATLTVTEIQRKKAADLNRTLTSDIDRYKLSAQMTALEIQELRTNIKILEDVLSNSSPSPYDSIESLNESHRLELLSNEARIEELENDLEREEAISSELRARFREEIPAMVKLHEIQLAHIKSTCAARIEDLERVSRDLEEKLSSLQKAHAAQIESLQSTHAASDEKSQVAFEKKIKELKTKQYQEICQIRLAHDKDLRILNTKYERVLQDKDILLQQRYDRSIRYQEELEEVRATGQENMRAVAEFFEKEIKSLLSEIWDLNTRLKFSEAWDLKTLSKLSEVSEQLLRLQELYDSEKAKFADAIEKIKGIDERSLEAQEDLIRAYRSQTDKIKEHLNSLIQDSVVPTIKVKQNAEVQSLQKNVSELRQSIASKEDELTALQNKHLLTLQEQRLEAQTIIGSLEARIAVLSDENAELTSSFESQLQARDILHKEEIERKDAEITSLKGSLASLLEESQQELASIREQMEELQPQILQLQSDRDALLADKKKLLQHLQTCIAKLHERSQDKSLAKELAQVELRELANTDDFETIRTILDLSFNSISASHSSNNEDTDISLDDESKRFLSEKQEIARLQQTIDEFSAREEGLVSRHRFLEQQHQELIEAHATLEQLYMEQVETVERKQKLLTGALIKVKKHGTNVGELQIRIKLLEEHISSSIEESDVLESLRKQVQAQKTEIECLNDQIITDNDYFWTEAQKCLAALESEKRKVKKLEARNAELLEALEQKDYEAIFEESYNRDRRRELDKLRSKVQTIDKLETKNAALSEQVTQLLEEGEAAEEYLIKYDALIAEAQFLRVQVAENALDKDTISRLEKENLILETRITSLTYELDVLSKELKRHRLILSA